MGSACGTARSDPVMATGGAALQRNATLTRGEEARGSLRGSAVTVAAPSPSAASLTQGSATSGLVMPVSGSALPQDGGVGASQRSINSSAGEHSVAASANSLGSHSSVRSGRRGSKGDKGSVSSGKRRKRASNQREHRVRSRTSSSATADITGHKGTNGSPVVGKTISVAGSSGGDLPPPALAMHRAVSDGAFIGGAAATASPGPTRASTTGAAAADKKLQSPTSGRRERASSRASASAARERRVGSATRRRKPRGSNSGKGSEVFATIGKYTVYTRVLGRGHASEVRGCRNRETRRRYAMKIVRKERGLGATKNPWGITGALATEIELLQRVRHPHVVRLVDIVDGETGTDLNLVFELLRPLQRRVYTEKEARPLFRQLVEGVAYLHSQNILHRDIKPSNMLLSRKADPPVVKLSDLGSAAPLRHNDDVVHTPAGTTANWPPEMVPPSYGFRLVLPGGAGSRPVPGDGLVQRPERELDEVREGHGVPGNGLVGGGAQQAADGDGVDGDASQAHASTSGGQAGAADGTTPGDAGGKMLRGGMESTFEFSLPFAGKPADVWALGVTLYTIVMGKHPFLGTTRERTFEAILNKRLHLDASRVDVPGMPDMSDELADLLNWMLAKQPFDRPTVSQILRHPWLLGSAAQEAQVAAAAARAAAAPSSLRWLADNRGSRPAQGGGAADSPGKTLLLQPAEAVLSPGAAMKQALRSPPPQQAARRSGSSEFYDDSDHEHRGSARGSGSGAGGAGGGRRRRRGSGSTGRRRSGTHPLAPDTDGSDLELPDLSSADEESGSGAEDAADDRAPTKREGW